jgi:isoleucyl-tRNA synthetase
MGLSLRKKSNLRVRQPLAKIVIPVRDEHFKEQVEKIKSLVCSELNIKDVEFISADNSLLVMSIKPNFKTLGPRYCKIMKSIAAAVASFSQQQISTIENEGRYSFDVEGQPVELLISDVEIATQDIPGWVVANEGTLTVALDITLTQELVDEGIARELVNRIQNIRKEGYDVTDRINVTIESGAWDAAVRNHMDYICSETLTTRLEIVPAIEDASAQTVEITEGSSAKIIVAKV